MASTDVELLALSATGTVTGSDGLTYNILRGRVFVPPSVATGLVASGYVYASALARRDIEFGVGFLGEYANSTVLATVNPSPALGARARTVDSTGAEATFRFNGSAWIPITGGSAAPYLGQAGVRGRMNTANIAGGANYGLRSIDTEVSVVDLNGIFAGWAFWRLNNGNEQTFTGSTRFMAYAEYPAGSGTFYPADENVAAGSLASPQPVTFNFGTATDKTLIMNWSALKVSRGVPIRWWTMQVSSDQVFYRQGQTLDQIWPSGQGMVNSGSITFANILDSYGTNFAEYSFPAIVFGGKITQRSALSIPDSREEASSDGARAPNYVNGMIGPGIAQNFGLSNMGASGMSLVQFLTGNAYAQRQLLSRFFTDVVQMLGVNDISGQAQTSAQHLTNCATFATLWTGKRLGLATIAPNTSATTDGFNSIANQASNNGPTILQANAEIRKIPSGYSYVYDIAREIDPYDTGLVPVSLNKTLAARATTAVFTGSIAGNVLTMSALTSGSLKAGDPITDSLTGAGNNRLCCTVIRQLTGTAGGSAGATFLVSRTQPASAPIASTTMYAAGFAMTDFYHYTTAINDQAKPNMALAAINYMGR